MLRYISSLILRLFGWKVEGQFPQDLRKYVLVVAPHRSGWEVPLGWLVRNVHPLPGSRFMAKYELKSWPIVGWVLRILGAIYVDRHNTFGQKVDYVAQVCDAMASAEQFTIAIAVEGTRTQAAVPWKTSFYRIARRARVPVVPVAFDYTRKIVHLGAPISVEQDPISFRATLLRWYIFQCPNYRPDIPSLEKYA